MRTTTQFRLFVLALVCALLTSGMALGGPGDGTVLGVTKIVDHGSDALRWNLVIVAEGFTSAQQAAFNTYAQQMVDVLFSRSPYDAYTAAINVSRINVASTQSGADDPLACGGTGVYVSTYFDASFCNSGIRRLLLINSSLGISVLNTWVPQWDQAVVIVNSSTYGGAGGQPAVTSVASGWTEVMIHEIGHSAFGLADEYEYWAGCGIDTDRNYHPAYEPIEPNVTIETNRALVKWRDLIAPATPVPTTINANCLICDPQSNPLPSATVGLYEGAHYYHCDAYRPQFNCVMRALYYGLCGVCRREIGNVLTPYLPSSCSCPYPGDMNSDGLINVLDVTGIIGVVFRGAANVQDPLCPIKRADFTGDGTANVLDVVAAINRAFKGGPVACNPCNEVCPRP